MQHLHDHDEGRVHMRQRSTYGVAKPVLAVELDYLGVRKGRISIRRQLVQPHFVCGVLWDVRLCDDPCRSVPRVSAAASCGPLTRMGSVP